MRDRPRSARAATTHQGVRSGAGDELLQRATAVVRARRRAYGEPALLFERVAMRWSQVLGTPVSPAQVIVCLLDHKLARLAHDPRHLDSLVDVIGYSVVLHELAHDASAEEPAAVAELAGHKGSTGVAAAEVPLRSAEGKRSAG